MNYYIRMNYYRTDVYVPRFKYYVRDTFATMYFQFIRLPSTIFIILVCSEKEKKKNSSDKCNQNEKRLYRFVIHKLSVGTTD